MYRPMATIFALVQFSQSDVLVLEQNGVVRRVDNGSGQLQLQQLLMLARRAG